MIPIQSHVCAALPTPVLTVCLIPSARRGCPRNVTGVTSGHRLTTRDAPWDHAGQPASLARVLRPADTCPSGPLFEIWATVNSRRFVPCVLWHRRNSLLTRPGTSPHFNWNHLIPNSSDMICKAAAHYNIMAPKPITWGLLIAVTDVLGQHKWTLIWNRDRMQPWIKVKSCLCNN